MICNVEATNAQVQAVMVGDDKHKVATLKKGEGLWTEAGARITRTGVTQWKIYGHGGGDIMLQTLAGMGLLPRNSKVAKVMGGAE